VDWAGISQGEGIRINSTKPSKYACAYFLDTFGVLFASSDAIIVFHLPVLINPDIKNGG
jgi:hypothetical protein